VRFIRSQKTSWGEGLGLYKEEVDAAKVPVARALQMRSSVRRECVRACV